MQGAGGEAVRVRGQLLIRSRYPPGMAPKGSRVEGLGSIPTQSLQRAAGQRVSAARSPQCSGMQTIASAASSRKLPLFTGAAWRHRPIHSKNRIGSDRPQRRMAQAYWHTLSRSLTPQRLDRARAEWCERSAGRPYIPGRCGPTQKGVRLRVPATCGPLAIAAGRSIMIRARRLMQDKAM